MPDSKARNLSRDGAAAPAAALLPGAPVAPALRAVPEDRVPEQQASGARRYRRRVVLVLAGLAAAFGPYWGSSYVFAYTDDAYVTSDLVAVAPQITGRILAVPITDNETVTKGTLLALIDPRKVAARCPRFATFIAWLNGQIDMA